MSNSVFNPSENQRIDRNVGRIRTLKLAIEQEKNEVRKSELTKELERRQSELKSIKIKIEQSI